MSEVTRRLLDEAKRRLRAQLVSHPDEGVRTLAHIAELPDNHPAVQRIVAALRQAQSTPSKEPQMSEPETELKAFQHRVGEWMVACFTPQIIADKLERADRFIEEALELVQATGYSADRARALVDYVFNRPVGEPSQEVGGVRVTLSALCNPHGIDEDAAAEAELARVWTKIDKIRAKQATKPVGSALPIPRPTPEIGEDGLVERLLTFAGRLMHAPAEATMRQAADRLILYREALERIAEGDWHRTCEPPRNIDGTNRKIAGQWANLARAALSGERR